MHTCHASACHVPVAPALFACRRHWRALPREMQQAIWQHYRKGQEDGSLTEVSVEYVRAARAAVVFLASWDGVTPDTRLYDLMLSSRGLTA